ncbi:MAG: SGNH/GDSL hydrolase family protein [Chitinophagaceae bacterium]
MSFKRDNRRTVIFFGDSITEQGRQLNGYISLINRQIEAMDLVKKYQTIGAGISGDRVYDLYLRIEKDVLSKSPNITVVYIGINDVWAKNKTGTGLDIERYEKFYRAIIVKLLSSNSKVILCTPSLIGELKDKANVQDKDLDLYSDVVRKLVTEYHLYLCDLRSVFTNYIQEHNYENIAEGLLTTDGVHLNDEGNKLVATYLWDTIKSIQN